MVGFQPSEGWRGRHYFPRPQQLVQAGSCLLPETSSESTTQVKTVGLRPSDEKVKSGCWLPVTRFSARFGLCSTAHSRKSYPALGIHLQSFQMHYSSP